MGDISARTIPRKGGGVARCANAAHPLGPAIAQWLTDPAVVEVMLNPDGRLWVDQLTEGLVDTGEQLSAADGERIVRVVAHHVGVEVHAGSPRVSAELPETGERFEGLIPPVVSAPAFAIRKPAVAVFTLEDYVQADVMSCPQANTLRAAIADRRNILVAGDSFAMPEAYAFIPINSRGDPNYGPPPDALNTIMQRIQDTGVVIVVRGFLRTVVADVLKADGVKDVVVGPMANRGQMVAFFTDLFGRPPAQIDGVQLWRDVDRAGVVPAS